MGVTAAGARIGYLTLAINVIVMQFFQFFSFFMDGFAYSGEAMIGLRCGERNFVSLNKCVRRLLQWTLSTGVGFSILYFFGLESIASLLTDQVNVIEGVLEIALWIGLIPIVSCWAFIYDGFYIGITDTFQMMISTLLSAIVFFGILMFNDHLTKGLANLEGNQIIWTAFLSYLRIRGIYMAIAWKPSLKKWQMISKNETA